MKMQPCGTVGSRDDIVLRNGAKVRLRFPAVRSTFRIAPFNESSMLLSRFLSASFILTIHSGAGADPALIALSRGYFALFHGPASSQSVQCCQKSDPYHDLADLRTVRTYDGRWA